MAFEMTVALTVTDDKVYEDYRNAMRPLLEKFGSGFRFDFVVSKVLISASELSINRVFAIYFKDRSAKEEFFSNPEYKSVRAKFFEHSVATTTIIGEYERV